MTKRLTEIAELQLQEDLENEINSLISSFEEETGRRISYLYDDLKDGKFILKTVHFEDIPQSLSIDTEYVDEQIDEENKEETDEF